MYIFYVGIRIYCLNIHEYVHMQGKSAVIGVAAVVVLLVLVLVLVLL